MRGIFLADVHAVGGAGGADVADLERLRELLATPCERGDHVWRYERLSNMCAERQWCAVCGFGEVVTDEERRAR